MVAPQQLIAFFNRLGLTDTEIKLKGDQSFLPKSKCQVIHSLFNPVF